MQNVVEALPWAFVVIGGPIILGGAILWARLRTRRREETLDPGTSSDDPSQGMR